MVHKQDKKVLVDEKSLKALIDYSWNDEERSYAENDFPKNHIFNKIRRLKSDMEKVD